MKKKILILEDDMIVQKSMITILELQGYDVQAAKNCKEALTKASIDQFNLLFLDYNLYADEVGWDIAKDIRNDIDLYGMPKIVAMSATLDLKSNDLLKDQYRCYIDHFLPKPFDFEELQFVIQQTMN